MAWTWDDLIGGGIPGVLDLPSEGVTPSSVSGPPAASATETNPPINAVPQQQAPGGASGGTPKWIVGLGIGIVVIAAVLAVRK